MGEEGVKLFGMWASPFSLRVEWALKLKGIEYEYVNEDIPHNKSADLLKYNPVHKKIPVLVHAGKPIAESSVIIQYIDEAWKDGYPILPEDPYERALARFWVHFTDEKVMPAVFAVYCREGEQQQKALKESQDQLRIMGEALKGNKFFGGETIGFTDIMTGWLVLWVRIIEEVAGVTIVDEGSLPAINAWFDDFSGLELVKERQPPLEKLVALNRERRELILAGKI